MSTVSTLNAPEHVVVDGGCPECGHPDQAKRSWLDRFLEKRGAASYNPCPWRVEYEADYCGCEHPYHSH